MWTAEEFSRVLERHPLGGTLWTGTKRMVRYIRVLRLNEATVVAIMTERRTFLKGPRPVDVEIYVKTSKGVLVSELRNASETPEFTRRIVTDPILGNIDTGFRPGVNDFLSLPDKTRLHTW